MAQEFKIFAVFGGKKGPVLHTNFRLLPERYIQVNNGEPTPIEDYGDWMLFKETVTEVEAEQQFLDKLAENEDETIDA